MRQNSPRAAAGTRSLDAGATGTLVDDTFIAPATVPADPGAVPTAPPSPSPNAADAAEPSPPAPATAPMDEVTLAFATWLDTAGVPRTLSESVVQATIFCAADGERTRQRFVFQREGETVRAVAPVYWPLLVFRTPEQGRVVVFDGTGLWKRSFHHSLLPPLEACSAELSHPPAAADVSVYLRGIRSIVLGDAGSETLTVEGFLPTEAPLFSDIISQSAFRTEPLPAHPGFLPTRHPVAWYEATVSQISRSISQFDRELGEIRDLRAQVEATRTSTLERIASERKALESELRNRVRFYAHAEMEREAETLHRSLWEQTMVDLDRIRQANAAIASARASAATAEELSKRAAAAGGDLTVWRDRARKARDIERDALQAIREARGRIELLHERERQAFGVLTDRVALVEQRSANDLAVFDLQQAEVEAASVELLQALDAQTARRSAERAEVAAHLVELPSLNGVQTLWFPLWVAELIGPKGSRFRVFPPMQLRTGMKIGESIKTLFGGVVLPLESRTARFEQALRSTLEKALEEDPWLKTAMGQIVRAADATADPEFLQHLALGLQELRQSGWITPEQERGYFESCSQHLRTRPFADSPRETLALGRPSVNFVNSG
ncbi:MAG: hypothetical protein L3K19_03435 [Thermoplasmata archaeon]|nr:hypothetical protein [Thermoplasmata archaeon]